MCVLIDYQDPCWDAFCLHTCWTPEFPRKAPSFRLILTLWEPGNQIPILPAAGSVSSATVFARSLFRSPVSLAECDHPAGLNIGMASLLSLSSTYIRVTKSSPRRSLVGNMLDTGAC